MLIFLNLHIYGNIHRLFLKQIQVIYSDEHKKQKNKRIKIINELFIYNL